MDVISAAHEKAEHEGRKFMDVLREELDPKRTPKPERSNECLNDIEIRTILEEQPVSLARLNHVENCRWCIFTLIPLLRDGFWTSLRQMQKSAIQ